MVGRAVCTQPRRSASACEVGNDGGSHRVVGGHGGESVVHLTQCDGFGDELAWFHLARSNLIEQVTELDGRHSEGPPEINLLGNEVVDRQRHVADWPLCSHADLNMGSSGTQ